MAEFRHIPMIDREEALEALRAHLGHVLKGRGAVVCFTGEIGYGKTWLLEHFAQECRDAAGNLLVLNAVCQQPLGSLHIGEVQPLYPFRHIMEQMTHEDRNTAKKKLYQSIGMTVLATLPLVGEVFYAAKEISRDLKEFKSGQAREEQPRFTSSQLIGEYVAAIERVSRDHPLLILLDDMQWCDTQSVQLLTALSQAVAKLPVLLLVAYRDSDARLIGHPLLPYIDSGLAEGTIAQKFELQPFSPDQIRQCCRLYLPNYTANEQFEQWIFNHSSGVPGVVVEYLRYFLTHSPFDEQGRFSDKVESGTFVPATVNALFAAAIEQLSEDDRTLLSLASVEGRECTVFMLTQLLNTDVLTTIRRLRSLQQRTGILRSRGPEVQYGVKTTVYEFTQALHHKYFLQSLEYEERTTIHARIAEILQKQFEEAESEGERETIAPYLAAHSGESGDRETMQAMILRTAYTADRYDSSDVLDYLFDVHSSWSAPDTPAMQKVEQEFLTLVNNRRREELVHDAGSTSVHTTRFGVGQFPAVRDAVIEHFLAGRYNEAWRAGEAFLTAQGESLSPNEQLELQTLLARCLSERGDIAGAEKLYRKALTEAQTLHNREWECFVLIGLAILAHRQGKSAEISDYLHRAVEIALLLPREFQLLTSTNIAELLREMDADEAHRHQVAAARLAEELQFYTFAAEAFRG